MVSVREDGRRRALTWAQLRDATVRLAGALVEWGVRPGDRVAAWLPNVPQALVAMLAANWVGAVFTSTSPDFGASGVLDRFGQVRPKVLFAADGYWYANKAHDRLTLLPDILAGLPDVERVVLVPELGDADTVAARAADLGLHAVLFADAAGEPVPVERRPFRAPGFILYSSGTTGVPKCIVHRAGGVLMQHLKEHQLHCDIRPGDRVFYYTTLRMDDVELAGVGAGLGRDRGALRRVAVPPSAPTR